MSTYKAVNSRGKEVFTDILLHPGEILEMEIEARGLKKADVAFEIGMKPSHFNDLLHGRRHVSAAVALRLEHLFDISAEYWMRVQVYYDLFVERKREKEAA